MSNPSSPRKVSLVSLVLPNSEIKRVPLSSEPGKSTGAWLSEIEPDLKLAEPAKWSVFSRGRELDPKGKLADLGLRPGSTIYAKEAPESDLGQETDEPVTSMYQQFAMALSMALRNPGLKRAIAELNTKENLQSLWVACPGMADDPVALALISRPETLLPLMEEKGFESIKKKHPWVIHAVEYIVAAINEESASSGASSGPAQDALRSDGVLGALQYHLDTLSDGEDTNDDEDDAMGGGDGNPLQRNTSFSAITPNQLAAAIAAAWQGGNNPMGGGSQEAAAAAAPTPAAAGGAGPSAAQPPLLQMPSLPSIPSTAASSAPASAGTAPPASAGSIDQNMMMQALQQAMRASASGPTTATADGSAVSARLEAMLGGAAPADDRPSPEEDMTEKVAHIVEMGIADASVARRALEFLGGDVAAAIELILSGQNV